MKRGWWIVGGAGVIVVALIAWSATRPEATVEVVHPERRTIRAYAEEQARTQLPQDYLIAMPIAGWLEPIDLREGDAVTQGEVVARLDADDLEDHVHQAEQRIAVLEAQIAETEDHRLEENALVEANATVKAIDETVAASVAKLEATKALLDFSESELKRVKGLIESDTAASRELRQAELAYRQARAEYESDRLELAALRTIQAVSYIGPKFITDYIDRKSFTLEQRQKELAEAKTQLKIEQRNLARAEIRSPVDGVVLERRQTRRQYLAAGTPLLTIGRLQDLEVIAEVLSERATRLSPGDAVEVFGDAIENGPIAGRVLRVYPAGFRKVSSLGVEQQRVNVSIGLDSRPPALGAEFRVQVRIFYAESVDALTLPRTALYRSADGGWRVMAVEDGRTAEREVSVGLMNDDRAEITKGLDESAEVLLRPSREITAGMRVATEN